MRRPRRGDNARDAAVAGKAAITLATPLPQRNICVKNLAPASLEKSLRRDRSRQGVDANINPHKSQSDSGTRRRGDDARDIPVWRRPVRRKSLSAPARAAFLSGQHCVHIGCATRMSSPTFTKTVLKRLVHSWETLRKQTLMSRNNCESN